MNDDLVKRLRKARVWPDYSQSRVTIETAHEAADHIEALEMQLESANEALREQLDIREALEAENERLRGVLEAVWKEATTMRNASKLVGPYPKEPASNRVWVRSMYHAGRNLHALIKPVRAALGEKQ